MREESATLRRIRSLLLFLVIAGTAGVWTDLFLIHHYEDPKQLIPLVLGGFGLLTASWAAIRPSLLGLRVLQFVMLLYIGAGVIGITLHFQANAEFQREIDPTISGFTLFRKVTEATAPPALSPGMLIQLGLLGLVYTYRHPALLLSTDYADCTN